MSFSSAEAAIRHRHLAGLSRDNRENKEKIAKLEQELVKLSDQVKELAFKIDRIDDRETNEREKLILRLENIILRYERGLPPPDTAA